MTTSSDYWIVVPYKRTEERFLFVFTITKYTEQLNYDRWYPLCGKCGEDASEWSMKGEKEFLLAPVNAYVMSKISAKASDWEEECWVDEEAFLDEFTECWHCNKPIPELKKHIRLYRKLGDKKWSAEAEAKRREAEAKIKEWETKRREAEVEAYKERLRQETIQSLEERARQGDLIAYHEWKKLTNN